jgi:hypothetical protein
MHHHVIADLHVLDARANSENGGRAFVAKEVRQELVRALDRVNFIDLRATNATEVHLYQDLAKSEFFRKFNFIND